MERFALYKRDIVEQIHFDHRRGEWTQCHFCQLYSHDIVIQRMMVVLLKDEIKTKHFIVINGR